MQQSLTLLEPIRDRLVQERSDLRALLVRLRAAMDIAEHDTIRALWTELFAMVRRVLDAEDADLVPVLSRLSSQDARALAQEHRYLRSQLVALSGKTLDLRAARGFIDELSAHARSEERVLAKWPQSR